MWMVRVKSIWWGVVDLFWNVANGNGVLLLAETAEPRARLPKVHADRLEMFAAVRTFVLFHRVVSDSVRFGPGR